MATRTAYLEITARSRPAAEQLAYRAWRQHTGCQRLCHILGIRVRVEGTLPEEGGMLLVCNHFGILDPVVLSAQVPLAPVSKAEVRDWPFLGWVSRIMGTIFVERERRTSTGAFVEAVHERLRHGVHVLVFPEGTTTADRTLQPFKTGAFEAAAGLADGAVLPLYLDVECVEGRPADEANRARVVWADPSVSFARHAWQLLAVRRVDLCVRVGEPIATTGRDRKDLAQISHEQLLGLGTWAQPG